MGLFDIFRTDPEKLDIRKRPIMPQKLQDHLRYEVELVHGTHYHQDALDPIHDSFVDLVISPDIGEYGHTVTLADGTVIGEMRPEQMPRIVMGEDGTAVAEVIRPRYSNMDEVRLYIPLNSQTRQEVEAELAHRAEMEEFKIWVNVDAAKWNGETVESGHQIEYHDCDFVVTERKKAKPLLSVVKDGTTLTTFNARMKVYKDLMERSQYHIRLLIVKRYDGEYGPFYKLGFYF